MKDYLELFKQIGMIKEGHFELTSGLHSARYFEKFRLLEHPNIATLICQEIAENFKTQELEIIAGPTTGGIIIAYEVARYLNKRCIFAEKTTDGREFKRGFEIRLKEKILVVDDVFTTGGSVMQTIEAIKKRNGTIIGVAVIIDRSEMKIDFGVPFFAIYSEKVANWYPADCPLCKQGIPLHKPGGSKIT
ncbi:MAG: orotate phosphoribosyltransferase [Candidatus Stahlbacteria bacterium]|nr:orotate phosphoribosyltransferase [Candidatus Stahlbacteria bacterium]